MGALRQRGAVGREQIWRMGCMGHCVFYKPVQQILFIGFLEA